MLEILTFLLGLIIVAVFSFNAFRTARDTERNPFAWAALVAGVGLGLQIFLPIFILALFSVALAVGLITPDWVISTVFLGLIIMIISVAVSVVVMLRLVNYAGRLPDTDESTASEPPPPPDVYPT